MVEHVGAWLLQLVRYDEQRKRCTVPARWANGLYIKGVTPGGRSQCENEDTDSLQRFALFRATPSVTQRAARKKLQGCCTRGGQWLCAVLHIFRPDSLRSKSVRVCFGALSRQLLWARQACGGGR